MKNFEIIFEGPKSHWGSFFQWFSFSLETGFEGKRLHLLSSHLWIFGVQVYEFVLRRKLQD